MERILCPKPGKSFAIEYLSPALEFRLRKPTTVVDTVVFHATVEPTLKSSLSILRERGFSYHYLVDKDGTAVQCVAPTNVAFHAGQSTGPQGTGVNEYSIGISLVNLNNGIDPFTKAQIETAVLITTRLKTRFPNLKFITTHAAISPGRKNDPDGFPIKDIAEATGLCVWL